MPKMVISTFAAKEFVLHPLYMYFARDKWLAKMVEA